MPKKLTKSEYELIKQRLKSFSTQTVASMQEVRRGISVIRRIANTKNFEQYKSEYWKTYSPSLWQKFKGRIFNG